jgi:hypothetical protein
MAAISLTDMSPFLGACTFGLQVKPPASNLDLSRVMVLSPENWIRHYTDKRWRPTYNAFVRRSGQTEEAAKTIDSRVHRILKMSPISLANEELLRLLQLID